MSRRFRKKLPARGWYLLRVDRDDKGEITLNLCAGKYATEIRAIQEAASMKKTYPEHDYFPICGVNNGYFRESGARDEVKPEEIEGDTYGYRE